MVKIQQFNRDIGEIHNSPLKFINVPIIILSYFTIPIDQIIIILMLINFVNKDI